MFLLGFLTVTDCDSHSPHSVHPPFLLCVGWGGTSYQIFKKGGELDSTSNWEILTKKLVPFKRQDGVKKKFDFKRGG